MTDCQKQTFENKSTANIDWKHAQSSPHMINGTSTKGVNKKKDNSIRQSYAHFQNALSLELASIEDSRDVDTPESNLHEYSFGNVDNDKEN